MVILVSDNDHVPQEPKTICVAAAQWRASQTTIEHIYQSQCHGILGNETFDTVTCQYRANVTVFSWQTSPFNADVSPSVDSISERPILFIKFSVNKKAIAVQRSECEIQIFIEKPSRYLPTNAGQDQRAFSDSFGVTLHYVTLQFGMDLLACNNLIAVVALSHVCLKSKHDGFDPQAHNEAKH
ncbi:hypothetical protein DY000_02050856 [Brassica cretica]|uniref:Regulator of MON1-CCZ1 complex N-terminal domain-containing protein n=1 Tax=Brassica cretica TaxID=69181 RepID=A0ABQ7F9R7_BRACR|nr:hypothetical protein DY000_02050856 [Brassica cretica]